MKCLKKFYEVDFVNNQGELKKAYLKANRWIAEHIINNDKFNDKVVWRIKKVSLTTVTLTLYFELDISQELSKNCKACKEFHNSFFINAKYNCDSCALKSFTKRIAEKERIAYNYYAEHLK